MNTLQFTASLVGSLAWPMAVILIALVFRNEIRHLASRPVRRLRAGPVEMEFDRVGTEVEMAIDASVSTRRQVSQSAVIEELESVVGASPLAAVLDAHAAVERELRDLIKAEDPTLNTSQMSVTLLSRQALERGIMTPEAAKAVEGITVMRNLAAHGKANDITPERAREYLALVDAVIFTLHQRPVPSMS